MTVELDTFEKWFHEIPENWRGQPPRDLEERIKYDEFMIQHVRECQHFTIGQKLKLVHQLGLDLEKTDTKLRNRHECESSSPVWPPGRRCCETLAPVDY